jgi:hypothetical protein
MRAIPALLLLALALPARAAPTADFELLQRDAERIDALEPFLSRYVGRCTDVYERRACEANVAAARQAMTGKTFAVRIPDAATLVKAELRGSGYLVLFTPFVDGGGLALTNGTPSRQDAAGHPIIGLIPITGALPPGTLEMEFQSPFRVGAIELEIVFRPEKAWRLARKGERGNYEGVAARFLAIRVIDARTGNPIAAKVL